MCEFKNSYDKNQTIFFYLQCKKSLHRHCISIKKTKMEYICLIVVGSTLT
jgi:hypothetical protein